MVFYQYGNRHYLEDIVCSNALPGVTNGLIVDMLVKHKVQRLQIESNAMGLRAGDTIQQLLEEKVSKCHVTKKRTTANKETKIIIQSDVERCTIFTLLFSKRRRDVL